ncbi:hypothetical protein SAMN02746019_00013840, partial [Thermoflexus hugenholtzii JAD2]
GPRTIWGVRIRIWRRMRIRWGTCGGRLWPMRRRCVFTLPMWPRWI